MDNQQQENIVATALRAGRESAVKVHASPLPDGKPFVILQGADGGQAVRFIDERFVAPPRKSGTVHLNDEASFMAYWRTHQQPASSIFATLDPACIIAIFNENGVDPDFRDHRAVYKLAYSKEYLDWTARDGQSKKFDGNIAFAEWLENHLTDMLAPPAAKMMEIALNMSVTANASYSKVSRLSDGNTKFAYTNQVEGKSTSDAGEIVIPDQFSIGIPVFQGLTAEQHVFQARFRYRLSGSTLSLWYELVRPHKVVEKAFEAIVNRIQKGTEKTVLFGTP